MDFIINTDTNIFLALNNLHATFWDYFMYTFSGRWIWVPAYAVVAAVLIRLFGWRNGIMIIAATAIAVALSDQTCATFIRPHVQRLRPANPDNPISSLVHIVDGYRGGKYGFPSCHAANTFAFATTISLVLCRRYITVALFAWALLNCYSRIYLGVHYPGDLLTGACIGAIYGALMYGAIRLAGKHITFLRPSAPLRKSAATSYSYGCIYILLLTTIGIAAYSAVCTAIN